MPSPLRAKEAFAYTRWEALESDEVPENQNAETPFYNFEEEVPTPTSTGRPTIPWPLSPSNLNDSSRSGHSNRSSQRSPSPRFDLPKSPCWSFTIRVLVFLIILGLGWIMGFVVRYDPEMAKHAIDMISFASIQDFFEEFTSNHDHELGSPESADYARNLSKLWREFGFQKTEVDVVKTTIPMANLKDKKHVPCEISIKDTEGNIVWRRELAPESMAQVSYSASAIGEGQLTYGHFGRYEDFQQLGLNFSNSVAILRINQHYHVGSMVRNAQFFGAKAVILFPDPPNHFLTANLSEIESKISHNESLSTSVKLFPGDPYSPYYIDDPNASVPRIPVISISYFEAKILLANFTNAKNVPKIFTYALPLQTDQELKFTAMVEVNLDQEKRSVRNVIGTIPGAYEPTRYVIVGAHHDTWRKGSSQAGLGHSVLMELARIFGYMHQHSWKPGRSIIFASWDGEEVGQLGSTSWMNSHSKELNTRAVAYIHLDYILPGNNADHVASSPLFREIIERAAKSVPCPHKMGIDDDCTLFSKWIKEENGGDHLMLDNPQNPFQNVLGVSTIEVALKSIFMPYPHSNASVDTTTAVQRLLDPEFKHASLIAKFVAILIFQLVMTPNLPGSVSDYAAKIHQDIHAFVHTNDRNLDAHGVNLQELFDALNKFDLAAHRFHSTYNPTFPMEFLGHHEFSDQIMELERAFLLPVTFTELSSQNHVLLRNPFKHIIYGPDPLNQGKSVVFPQLNGALTLAKYDNSSGDLLWESVRREAFFVVDALESASCILDNHLVYTYMDNTGSVSDEIHYS
eukprot:maker-scaffold38_size502422-snap-gene-3.21 protein:Tk05876 transcript:maker-scaffold38_size502422-snap-gene-3.21-mRNA-1 annotation:"glutamate carboxypeptidase 2"